MQGTAATKLPPLAISGLVLLASIAAGIGGFFFTAFLFDSMNWCCFHSWALIHGSGVVVFLFWSYAGFHVAKFLSKAHDQFAPVPNLAYLCSALGTLFFTGFLMWPGLALSGYGIYRRLRHGDKGASGLLWAAVMVSALSFAYWAYIVILFATYLDSPG